MSLTSIFSTPSSHPTLSCFPYSSLINPQVPKWEQVASLVGLTGCRQYLGVPIHGGEEFFVFVFYNFGLQFHSLYVLTPPAPEGRTKLDNGTRWEAGTF